MMKDNNDNSGSESGSEHDFAGRYSEASFWDKLKYAAKSAGRELVEKALVLYRQFAKSLGIQVTKRKAVQAIPVVGALVGASFNAAFVNDIGCAAHMRRCKGVGSRSLTSPGGRTKA